MNCDFDIYAEDIYDYIVADLPGVEEDIKLLPDFCIERVDEHWLVAYGPLSYDRELSVSSLGYITIPKLYGLMDVPEINPVQTDITALEELGAINILSRENLNADGSGVLIGLVDTGLDTTLDIFKDEYGRTRIEAIWNQETDETFYEEQIENGIVGNIDYEGHGTRLASIVAGYKRNDYFGLAPKAGIVAVKLRQAKQYLRDYFLIKDDAIAYAESDIMLGIKFLANYARTKRMPMVLLIALGSGSGSRTGSSPLADMLDSLCKKPGFSVVTAVGNEGNERSHYMGWLTDATRKETIEINVDSQGKGFCVELWAETANLLTVAIESPSGEEMPRVPLGLGSSAEYMFLYERTRVTVDYQLSEIISGQEIIFVRIDTPTVGTWKLNVYSVYGNYGRYDAWLNIKNFLANAVYFVRSTPETTLTPPSAAKRVITVGAYNHITDSIYALSGRGVSADGRLKPDLVAPGVSIKGISILGQDRWSGTSISAAYAAGAVAMLMSYALSRGEEQLLNNSNLKSALLRGAIPNNNEQVPNNEWGYGKLNINNTFDMLRLR